MKLSLHALRHSRPASFDGVMAAATRVGVLRRVLSTVLPTGAHRPVPWLPDGGDAAAASNQAVRALAHVLGEAHILLDRDLIIPYPGLPVDGDLQAAHQSMSRLFSVSLQAVLLAGLSLAATTSYLGVRVTIDPVGAPSFPSATVAGA
jgi:hypothetical protein